MPRSLLVTFVLSLPLVAGCIGLPPGAIEQVRSAEREYRDGRAENAEKIATTVIDKYPWSGGTAEAYYIRGLARTRRGRGEAARKDFDDAIRLALRADLKAYAAAAAAMQWQTEGDYAQANRSYERALDLLPPDRDQSEILYRYGVSLMRAGRWDDARDVLRRARRDHPHGDFAAEAARWADWSHDYFTIQCGMFSAVANAQRLVRNLRSAGMEPTLVSERGRGYAVRVGQFPDYASAAGALPRVRRIVADAFICP